MVTPLGLVSLHWSRFGETKPAQSHTCEIRFLGIRKGVSETRRTRSAVRQTGISIGRPLLSLFTVPRASSKEELSDNNLSDMYRTLS